MDAVRCVLAGAVTQARLLDFERSDTSEDGALGQVPIAHEAVAAGLVTEVLELGQDGVDFELEGALEELTSTITDDLVER